jgi:hypothetical protein
MIWNNLYLSKNRLQTWIFFSSMLRASPVILYCNPESRKKWKDVNCSSSQHGSQASFIGWNLVLESFLEGLVTGFQMFCFGKALRFGRTTFSWLQGYKLTRRLGMLLHPKIEVYKRNINAFKFSLVKYKVWHCLHALPQWQWNFRPKQKICIAWKGLGRSMIQVDIVRGHCNVQAGHAWMDSNVHDDHVH